MMSLAPKEGGGPQGGQGGELPVFDQTILDPELLQEAPSEEEPAPQAKTKEHQRTFVFSPE